MDTHRLAEIFSDPAARLWLIIGLAVLAGLLLLSLLLGRWIGRLESRQERHRHETRARSDAVKRSRAVLTGQIGEQLAPLLPGFPCDPAELRFIGKPVDYIAFPGLSKGQPEAVVFIEVKSGQSGLSASERALKAAVLAGKVGWKEYRLPD